MNSNPVRVFLFLLTFASPMVDASELTPPNESSEAAAVTGGGTNFTVSPGQGVTFYQVDYPAVIPPLFDSQVGRVTVNLPELRLASGIATGYVNVVFGSDWQVRNLIVPDVVDYPYELISTDFALPIGSNVDLSAIDALVNVSDVHLTVQPTGTPSTFAVEGVVEVTGGEGAPNTLPPGPPNLWNTAIFEPILAGDTFACNPNYNIPEAALNQCFPSSIANSLEMLANTTSYTLAHPNVAGIKGDPSLVGQLEDTPHINRTVGKGTNPYNQGLPGKLRYLINNGQSGLIRTTHRGTGGGAAISGTVGTTTLSSTGVGTKISIQDIIAAVNSGKDVEMGYAFNGGGGHAVVVVYAGILGGRPYVVHASDLDQSDNTKGAGAQGLKFEWLKDTDNDGKPNLLNSSGAARANITRLFTQEYIGPVTFDFDLTITNIFDPAGHGCCVIPPLSSIEISREGPGFAAVTGGSGSPLSGVIDPDGCFNASSVSTVAGFPNVLSTFTGCGFDTGTIVDAQLTYGAGGGLPTGQPITYTVTLTPPDLTVAGFVQTIPEDEVLHVRPGQDLIVQANGVLNVQGALHNHGNVIVESLGALNNFGQFTGVGNVEVHGVLTNQPNAGFTVDELWLSNAGDVFNTGEMTIELLDNDGLFASGAAASQRFGAVFNNLGSLDLDGDTWTFEFAFNDGTVTNSGQWYNFGTLDSPGTFTQSGTLNNLCNGMANDTSGPIEPALDFPCTFSAHPTGLEEVPAVTAQSYGDFQASLDPTAAVARMSITLSDLDFDGQRTPDPGDDVTGIHVHNATAGTNGPIVFRLIPPDNPGLTIIDAANGQVTTTWGGISPTQVADLLAGNLYLNVHTADHPDGEIRGQLALDLSCPDENWTFFADDDGDFRGDPAVSVDACTPPFNYVGNSNDCDDTNIRLYNGSPEINNGLDDSCPDSPSFASIDELSGIALFSSPTLFEWDTQQGVGMYEVAISLSALFEFCTFDNTSEPSWDSGKFDAALLNPGELYNILARSLTPFTGSWSKNTAGDRGTLCSGP